ncbi:hypothetical protein CLU82_0299 [Flavobacterium sp. 5]|nr:hypothetical protein CLU82_0299 [Flavobacterium sp. 5]
MKKKIEAIVTTNMNIAINVEIIDALFKLDCPSCKVQLLNIQKTIAQYDKNTDAITKRKLKTNLFELLNFIKFQFILFMSIFAKFHGSIFQIPIFKFLLFTFQFSVFNCQNPTFTFLYFSSNLSVFTIKHQL